MTTSNSYQTKIQASNAWTARAIYWFGKKSSPFQSIGNSRDLSQIPTYLDDRVFFNTLVEFFAENGYFTDRHIALARLKIRPAYIEYLVGYLLLPASSVEPVVIG